ncbi:MAG: DUF2442 domain-containing protein [Bacteroidales bacterium]
MEKAYTINELRFEDDYLIIVVDNQTIKVKLSKISEKLAKASDHERNEFTISPSGYGIHWSLLDEDLSINGLLKAAK